jgi:hypothetical protein
MGLGASLFVSMTHVQDSSDYCGSAPTAERKPSGDSTLQGSENRNVEPQPSLLSTITVPL